jgi:hypothetical protein
MSENHHMVQWMFKTDTVSVGVEKYIVFKDYSFEVLTGKIDSSEV